MAVKDVVSIIPVIGKKLEKKVENKQVSKEKYILDKTVEQEIPFQKIYGNIVKVKDGKYLAYARTNAISLDDMDEEDQDVILSGYSEYLNGVTRSYQVYIPSYTLDIREQIEKIDKRIEEEDDKDIIDWLEDEKRLQIKVREENEVIDTQFYFVFKTEFKPTGNEENDYLKAKKELMKIYKTASDELQGIGLHLKMLNYEEIGKLYYYSMNPFAAGIQEPEFSNNTVIESQKYKVKKKEKELHEDEEIFSIKEKETNHLENGGIDFKGKIAPYSINDKLDPDYIKVGSAYMTIYEIYDYPKYPPRLWAKKLYKYRNNIDISIYIEPVKTSEVIKELDKAAIEYGSSMIDERTGEIRKAVTSIEKKMIATSTDISRTLDELEGGEQSYFQYSHFIMAKAKSVEELEDTCYELENVLGSMRVLFRKTSENMRNALWTVLPFGENRLGTKRSMLTSGVANGFPFTNYNFSHKDGVFIAINKYNMNFIYFDPWELDNANGVILGCPGAGKTTTLYKLEKGLSVVKDIKLRVIDPEGEQVRKRLINGREISFAESIGGEVIDYYVGSKHKINILEPEPDDEVESLIKPTINFVKLFLKKIMVDLQKSDINKLDYSLIYLYNKFGFYDDKETYYDDRRKSDSNFYLGRPKRKAPELYDLYQLWYEEPEELKNVVGETRHLANQLREWTRLGTNDLFDGQTNVDFKKKRIFFNLKRLDKEVKNIGMLVLYHKLWTMQIQNYAEEEVDITDEAHVVMKDDEIAEYVYDSNKRIRKYGGANIFSTQNVTDFTKSKWGPEIIKTCSWSIILKQNKIDADIIKDIYQMTRSEALKTTRFNRDKGEAYLVADKFRIPINVLLSEKEYEMTTTKIKDIKRQMTKKM